MKKERLLLLKTFFRSSSTLNVAMHSQDPKKKKKARTAFIGYFFLALLIVIYMGGAAFGIAFLGMGEVIPSVMALVLTLITLVFSLLKVNAYLFDFKGSEMLMAMPFHLGKIVSSKILQMYFQNLFWNMILSLSMLIGWALADKLSFHIVLYWLILTFFLPVIPMIIAAILGIFVARVGSGFKYKRIATTILTLILVIPTFFLSAIINKFAENEEVLVESLDAVFSKFKTYNRILPQVGWFSEAVLENKLSSTLLLVGVSLLSFELFTFVIEKSYLKIISKLHNSMSHTKVREKSVKKKSMERSIAFKEFKTFIGSTNYSVNCGMGQVLIVVLSITCFFVDANQILSFMTINDKPLPRECFATAVPLLIYMLVSMAATTCVSPSLEGKNYWIVQSLPISKKTLYNGKMLFNLYLTVPFAVFGVVCLDIALKIRLVESIFNILLVVILCLFSTVYGLVRGIKHIKLEWENDIEVIKQGSAVAYYLFPNFFGTIIVLISATALSFITGAIPAILLVIVIAGVLTLLSYRKVLKLERRTY